MSAPVPTETKTPLWLLIVVGALAAVAIVVAWGARLSWGLWQDETQMVWQAEGGWTIVRDKLGDPAQWVLFGYVEALLYFPGSPRMELWLRLPAVLGGIASGLLAYRLAERLVGKGTGLMAFVAMIGSPEMIKFRRRRRGRTRGRWRPAWRHCWASPAGWRRAAAAMVCCSRSHRRWSCTCTSCSPRSRSCQRSSCSGARAAGNPSTGAGCSDGWA